jgi:hypothetical protein
MTDLPKLHIVRDLDTGEVFHFDRLEMVEFVLNPETQKRSHLEWENLETGNTMRMDKREEGA